MCMLCILFWIELCCITDLYIYDSCFCMSCMQQKNTTVYTKCMQQSNASDGLLKKMIESKLLYSLQLVTPLSLELNGMHMVLQIEGIVFNVTYLKPDHNWNCLSVVIYQACSYRCVSVCYADQHSRSSHSRGLIQLSLLQIPIPLFVWVCLCCPSQVGSWGLL